MFVLFRGATGGTERGMQLLRGNGDQFEQIALDSWESSMCPMSTAAIEPSSDGALLAWEREGQIWWAKVSASGVSTPRAVPGDGDGRKHPTIAMDAAGQLLIAWAQGTAWAQGGDLVWLLFDPALQLIDTGRITTAIPPWSRAAAVARPDSGFYLIY